MQEEMKAGTNFYIDQRWLHKSFLHSFIHGFLRGIHDPALSQLLPFCARISPNRYYAFRSLRLRKEAAKRPKYHWGSMPISTPSDCTSGGPSSSASQLETSCVSLDLFLLAIRECLCDRGVGSLLATHDMMMALNPPRSWGK